MSHPSAHRGWAIAALVSAALVLGIDATALGLALPTLTADVEATTSQLQRFFSTYMLAFAPAMPATARNAVRVARRRRS